jgi:DNA-binding transcriptional ArsR family regulator
MIYSNNINIRNHLKRLMKDGLVERMRDGWYRRIGL